MLIIFFLILGFEAFLFLYYNLEDMMKKHDRQKNI